MIAIANHILSSYIYNVCPMLLDYLTMAFDNKLLGRISSIREIGYEKLVFMVFSFAGEIDRGYAFSCMRKKSHLRLRHIIRWSIEESGMPKCSLSRWGIIANLNHLSSAQVLFNGTQRCVQSFPLSRCLSCQESS